MRYLSLILAIACLASISLTGPRAEAFHGHHHGGYGYGGCGGYYGGYGGYYGAYYGGPAFYGPRMAYYSSGPYFSGPIYGPTMYSQPYRSLSYYGQPYYSAPIVGQPYASTPVYGQPQRTTALYPPAYSNGQVRTTASSEARPTTTVDVSIQDNSFQPPTITVQPGSTVRWTNNGSHNHTVTAQDNSWDSGDIAPGATYSATFQRPGTYSFYCRHHAGMQGTIVVGGGSAPVAQPGGSSLEARSGSAAPAPKH